MRYKTKFVRKLIRLRKKAIRKGIKLLTMDEILEEKHKQR